jgi:glycosyltransferase involved in cell wall biosynthesis
MTLVSIVTPSFNQASFLEQTICSVLQQDHHDLEYLVVDGGSSDGSVEIIKRYADRLTWWVSEPDHGQADAINKGFARVHGEIVAWLNSDDTYLPGAVSAAVRALDKHPEAVMVYGDMQAVDEHSELINTLKYRQLSLEELLCFQIIGQPAVFMRRTALDEAGRLNASFHCLLDHQLWIRLALEGRILYVGETWAAARYHAGAKNRAQAAQFGPEAFRILNWAKHDQTLGPVLARTATRARASAHRVDARYLLDGGQPWPALRAWTRALFIHPPTAFARWNLAASALLEVVGLGALRTAILRKRSEHLSG